MSSENFIWIPSLEQSDEGLFALIRDERYTITGNNKENNKGRERARKRNHGRSCRTRRVALDRCTYISTLMSLMKYIGGNFGRLFGRLLRDRTEWKYPHSPSYKWNERKCVSGATYRILNKKEQIEFHIFSFQLRMGSLPLVFR